LYNKSRTTQQYMKQSLCLFPEFQRRTVTKSTGAETYVFYFLSIFFNYDTLISAVVTVEFSFGYSNPLCLFNQCWFTDSHNNTTL